MQVSCKVASKVEICNEYIEDPQNKIARSMLGQPLRLKVKLSIGYSAGANPVSASFQNVHLSLEYPQSSVYTEDRVFRYEELNFDSGRNTPMVEETFFFPTNTSEASDQEVKVNLTYQQIKNQNADRQGGLQGALRSTSTFFILPFAFFANILPEVDLENKQFDIKFGLDKPCVSLLDLFSDLINDLEEMQVAPENPKQITFQLRNEQTVTMCVSKDSLKIKFQSNCASALRILFAEVYKRMTSSKYKYDLQTQMKLPTQDFQQASLNHFELRKQIKTLKKTLEDRSYQFRLI